MTPPVIERPRDTEVLPREARRRPPQRPDSPPPSRTEGIVQAIQAWLDAQL